MLGWFDVCIDGGKDERSVTPNNSHFLRLTLNPDEGP